MSGRSAAAEMIPRILRADALGLMRCSCSGRAAAASSLGASAASKAGAAGLCSRAASTQGAAATQPAGFLRRPGGSLQFWNAAGAGVVSRGMATQVSAEAPSSLARVGVLTRAKELLSDYKQLGKFKLSLLVVSTAAGGYVMGSGEHIDWRGLGWTCLGTMGAAASANTFNQIYEVKLDSLMKRTMNRPLPAGRVSRLHALAFAVATGTAGVALLAQTTNTLTAGLGLANIVMYAAIYTPLKTVSIANTWVGAVVGAVPPLMGWAAAAGDLSPGSAALAAVLYWWQMPHFMALAWMCKQDYGAGGYKMLSLLDATGRRTAACALRNSIYLMPLGIMAVCLGVTTDAFAFENALISGGMAATAGVFYQSPSMRTARLMFRASLLHLPLLMAAMMAHRIPNRGLSAAELKDNLRQRFASKETKADSSGSSSSSSGAHLMPLPPFPFLPVPIAERPQRQPNSQAAPSQ